ncbi:MAG: hypothetical protein M3295_08640 [Chloroflexota bacterium]|nr:hypothetical protein [Chloroflexota bacterium]
MTNAGGSGSDRLRRLFLAGALVAAVAAFLLLLAPACDDPDLGDRLSIVLFWLVLAAGVLSGGAILTRAQKPRGWKGWGTLLLLVLAAVIAAALVAALVGTLWFIGGAITCGP